MSSPSSGPYNDLTPDTDADSIHLPSPTAPIPGRGVAVEVDEGYEPSLRSWNDRDRDGDRDRDSECEAEDRKLRRKQWYIRGLALITACMLSLGAHYGSYLLGPLKTSLSRELGTNNVQFSIFIGSFSLNNTWTPLVGGILTARLGTAISSIIATGLILAGQSVLLVGRWIGSIRCMAFGCFIFGLGVSPLAVAQETIICRFFNKKGLGISLALGLVAGKGASFLSSIISLPLSQKYGPTAPFVVSTALATISFIVNLVYVVSCRWLARGAGVRQEEEVGEGEDRVVDVLTGSGNSNSNGGHQGNGQIESEIEGLPNSTSTSSQQQYQPLRQHHQLPIVIPPAPPPKRKINLLDLSRLGDPFWIYMLLNFVCGGIWYPFLHLGANLLQRRFQLTDSTAAKEASILLAGPLVLYPTVGMIVDIVSGTHKPPQSTKGRGRNADPQGRELDAKRHGQDTDIKRTRVVHKLFALSSVLTLLCYFWLILPVDLVKSPVPGLLSWSIGHGFSTLLLVLVVPGLVSEKYVSLALGAHKSIEMAGSTLLTTGAGLILDAPAKVSKLVSNTLEPETPIPADSPATWNLLFVFYIANIVQLGLIIWLWVADNARTTAVESECEKILMAEYTDSSEDENALEEEDLERSERQGGDTLQPLLIRAPKTGSRLRHASSSLIDKAGKPLKGQELVDVMKSIKNMPRTKAEQKRGQLFIYMYGGAVVAVWAMFVYTAIEKLRSAH